MSVRDVLVEKMGYGATRVGVMFDKLPSTWQATAWTAMYIAAAYVRVNCPDVRTFEVCYDVISQRYSPLPVAGLYLDDRGRFWATSKGIVWRVNKRG